MVFGATAGAYPVPSSICKAVEISETLRVAGEARMKQVSRL